VRFDQVRLAVFRALSYVEVFFRKRWLSQLCREIGLYFYTCRPTRFLSMCLGYNQRLMLCFCVYLRLQQLCDVVLISGNRRLPAHRLVLSAASHYLASVLLSCDVSSVAMPTEINIPEVDVSALEDVVNYIYTGESVRVAVQCVRGKGVMLPVQLAQVACFILP